MGNTTTDDFSAESTKTIPYSKQRNRTTSLEKKLATEVSELQTTYPEAEIQLWCQDEHRLGLKPILRRIYVPEGVAPIANVNWRYQWLWLYAFLHPKTGETYWWILPYVNTKLFSQVLADFAREFALGTNKHILLVVDRAGWHISRDLKIPLGLHLTFLPSYSRKVCRGKLPPASFTRITTRRKIMDSS